LLRHIWITKPGNNQIHKAICPRHKILKDFSFSASPLFFTNADTELTPGGEFYTVIHVNSWVPAQENLPVPCEFPPVTIKDGAEGGPANPLVHRLEGEIMM
jgi:hypothetical protein